TTPALCSTSTSFSYHSAHYLYLHSFPTRRSSDLSWWSCLRKRCDYYEVYQAYGPADLTHIGYHAAEKLALEHRTDCVTRSEHERSEEHTSELQSRFDLVCRLLLEKKNTK